MSVSAKDKMLKTFAIDYLSSVDGTRYQGSFTCKKLSIRDVAALGVRKAQLNGGMHFDPTSPGHGVDAQTDDFNNMLSHLEISLKACPPWWSLDTISDIALIGTIYKEVISFENSFLSRSEGQTSDSDELLGSSQGDSATPQSNANAAPAVTAVVGQEVQAALEP